MPEERYVALKKSDLAIIIILAIIPLFIKVLYSFVPQCNDYFMVKHFENGEEKIENIEADKTKSITIHAKYGDMILEFDSERGARVASSTCPCQICVNSGWSKIESIVCVPNSVIIQPIAEISESSSNKVDAVTR